MPSPTTSHPRRRDGDKAIEAVLLDVVAWANEATESDIAALLSRLRTGLADAAKAELRALEHELRDRDLTVVERERQRSARHQQLTETSERKLGALSTLLQATLAAIGDNGPHMQDARPAPPIVSYKASNCVVLF